jgi:hypothetical protein
MSALLMLSFLILLMPSLTSARSGLNPVIYAADGYLAESTHEKNVNAFIYDDGCIVNNDVEDPKVLNPKQCQDKDLVAYLNCAGNVGIVPENQRPEECK